jgi:transcriptional regulator with XRE-family HTH domain
MTIGARLRDERARLGVSQTELANVCGIAKNTQLNYEKDERSPDAPYLLLANKAGVDVHYVLFGERLPAAADQLSPLEAEVLSYFRDLSDYDKESLRRMAYAMASVGKDSTPAPRT